MTTRRRAEQKLLKSRRFLDYAEASEGEYPDVTISLSASAAINASDALLLANGASTLANEEHIRAVGRLRSLGLKSAAGHLAGALVNKSKAQYSERECSAREASEALKHAQRILRIAEISISSEGSTNEQ